jgi:hypothetical protein
VIALIVAQTTAIALLGLLVAGLLRSHAEILRRLHALGAGDDPSGPGRDTADFRVQAGVAEPRDELPDASDVAGVTAGTGDDEAIVVGVVGTAHDTLLAFLSSGCLTCAPFWERVASGEPLGLPAGTRLVVVTKGPEDESASAVARLAAGVSAAGTTVVMSTEAWEAYGVPGSPYFVHVKGRTGRVAGEGAATSWEQVTDLLATAEADLLPPDAPAIVLDPRARGDAARAGRIDRELAAAGIHPGHPSLYPGEDDDGRDDDTRR